MEEHGNCGWNLKVISIQMIPITETKLELALSKFKLANKKNPRKLMEEIASCEVKYGVPVSNGKKLVRIGGNYYGTVITVTKCARKAKELHAP